MVEKRIGIPIFDLKKARKDLAEAKKILREKEEIARKGGIFSDPDEGAKRRRKTRSAQSGAVRPDYDSSVSSEPFKRSEILLRKKRENEAKRIAKSGIYAADLEEGTKRRQKLRSAQSADLKSIFRDKSSKAPHQRVEIFKKYTEKIKKLEEDAKKREKDQKKYQKDLERGIADREKETKERISDLRKNLISFRDDPLGAIRAQGFGLIGKVLPPGFVAAVYTYVYDRIKQEFGPGGRWDLRKLVLNQVSDLLTIEQRIRRDRGDLYFASQHSSLLYQGAAGVSNTESQAQGMLRDILIDPGR